MDSIVFERPAIPDLVSIIIPTYHGERLIGATLDSIGRQTYPHWEVIVVEDGTKDDTQRLVEDFARKFPASRVDFSRNARNFGAAHARNVAFAKSAGEFVALLDSDDRWLPEHLEVSVNTLRKTGSDIVYSTVLMVEDNTEMVMGTWGPTLDELRDFPLSMFSRSFVTPSASVLRREVLADVGPWSTSHLYCEDFDFWLRCVAAGKTFHCVGGCHCLYRKNHQGATTQKICGTLEEVAMTTEKYMLMPGMRRKTTRKYAARAYLLAARFHATMDPSADPSADRSRVSPLMLHAWRLRPKRIKYLFQSLWWGFTERFRWRSRVAPKAPAPTLAIRPHAAQPLKDAA